MNCKHVPATPLPWDAVEDLQKEDADYIVHAANAYPKLIEALQLALPLLENEDYPEAQDLVALLRSLGEEL